MCGIAGIYAPNARLEPSAVAPMLASMAHRGPDDRGVQVLSQGELIFGHLRLSILDLSPLGHQPMSTPDGKVWIVYNGEIYNFRDIRAELPIAQHAAGVGHENTGLAGDVGSQVPRMLG